MKVESFLSHHGLAENPFEAEEARHDPIFNRLIETNTTHPDFPKVLGQIDRPSTAVVFGEKGTGKTAIRLLIGQKISEHNEQNPDHRILLVGYDDLNPVLDQVIRRQRQRMGSYRAARVSVEQLLDKLRLEDHQDAILSLAVTKLVDGLLEVTIGTDEAMPLPPKVVKILKKMPRQQRVDLAILAALYDQPRSGSVVERWKKLRSKLKLGWVPSMPLARTLGAVAAITAGVLLAGHYTFFSDNPWLVPGAGFAAAIAVVLFGAWALKHVRVWSLCRRVCRELLAVPRLQGDLRKMLLEMRKADLVNHPWPTTGAVPLEGAGNEDRLTGNQDSRYQLTQRLMGVLEALGYNGIIVLVDRVDEPAVVSGHPDRMRSIIWPMLENKFLQQDRVGLKLLLPIELRHLLHRESASFFQEARMDKQNMIDRLSWSGATLFDLCTSRLRACLEANLPAAGDLGSSLAGDNGQAGVDSGGVDGGRVKESSIQGIDGIIEAPGDGGTRSLTVAARGGVAAVAEEDQINLSDLFEEDVSREMIVDALEQMHQPRDAFKFLYSVIQEHCRSVSQEEASYKIPRLTLDAVRRHHSQRIQELYRGLAPA